MRSNAPARAAAAAGFICSAAPGSRVLSTKIRPRSFLHSKDFIVSLERAIGTANVGNDEDLWKSGAFDAEVYPELSPCRTILGLFKWYWLRGISRLVEDSSREQAVAPAALGKPNADGGYLVRSVPVQASSRKALRHRLATAAGVDANGAALASVGRPPDALLLLSGSHPVRRLLFAKRILPDVYDELRLATSMRDSGHLPAAISFWAVANPLTEADEGGVDRVRRKVQLGAEVILTQPPLAWAPFERWFRGVDASGSLRIGNETTRADTASSTASPKKRQPTQYSARATLLVGMPVITSPKGLRFWLDLCGVSSRHDICKEAFEAFGYPVGVPKTSEGSRGVGTNAVDVANHLTGSASKNSANGAAAAGTRPEEVDCPNRRSETGVSFGEMWFETTMSKLRALDSVDGVHVMAPGPGPRRRAATLITSGVFEK